MARHKHPRPTGKYDRRPPARSEEAAGERGAGDRPRRPERKGGGGPREDGHWLYGRHAVLAAIANPFRELRQIWLTREAQARFGAELAQAIAGRPGGTAQPQLVDRGDIEAVLGNAVHQGIAAFAAPLPDRDLSEVLPAEDQDATVLVLDQVTDPHNVGAILRSAEAFGAAAVVVTERHAPEETGTLAKAASGAIERVPLIRVVNLARELDYLKSRGFWILGLAGEATQNLNQAKPGGRIALVLGAEGEGLRRLTREHCDLLVRLPMAGAMPSLNVSNAAAVALYELNREKLR
ncbi:MAG: 23S rRNA (guanosine(2251)-2'-O)-methyltransferase RlmB [Reyranellaceae bacterium]